MNYRNKSRLERFNEFGERRTLFGFRNAALLDFSFLVPTYSLLIFITWPITPAWFFLALELLIALIGIIIVILKIIQSEKEIKKFTGHYYLFPPQEIYE